MSPLFGFHILSSNYPQNHILIGRCGCRNLYSLQFCFVLFWARFRLPKCCRILLSSNISWTQYAEWILLKNAETSIRPPWQYILGQTFSLQKSAQCHGLPWNFLLVEMSTVTLSIFPNPCVGSGSLPLLQNLPTLYEVKFNPFSAVWLYW